MGGFPAGTGAVVFGDVTGAKKQRHVFLDVGGHRRIPCFGKITEAIEKKSE